MKITLANVRGAFLDLFEAKTFQGEGEAMYSASFLFPPEHPANAAVEAAIEAVAKDKWGAKADAVLKASRAKDLNCLHDGDAKSDYAGFEGNMYVSTRSKTRPLVLDRDKSPLTAADGRPYPGCYVNAVIELWAQDNAFGKRVNAQLKGVQFLRDGDAFSGGAPATPDDFEDLGVPDEDEELA